MATINQIAAALEDTQPVIRDLPFLDARHHKFLRILAARARTQTIFMLEVLFAAIFAVLDRVRVKSATDVDGAGIEEFNILQGPFSRSRG